MADYDVAVCARCDADAEAVMLRAQLPHETVARMLPPTSLPVPWWRPLESFSGPAKAGVIAELQAALFSKDWSGRAPAESTEPITGAA